VPQKTGGTVEFLRVRGLMASMSSVGERIPYWLRKYPRPWVSVDWNVLRALPRGAWIPGSFTAVISDRALVEAINSERPVAFVAKLSSIVAHPDSFGRVLIGRYWDDLALHETQPAAIRPTAVAAIHRQLSAITRQLQERGDGYIEADETVIATSRGEGDEEAGRFELMMRQFVEWYQTHRPDQFREAHSADASIIADALREPSPAMAELASREALRLGLRSRYLDEHWVRELSQFPDRAAVARWLRITFCYALLALRAPDTRAKTHRNNFDDAYYAILGLYTGHLWTEDKALQTVTTLVSGGRTQVHSSWTTIPSGT